MNIKKHPMHRLTALVAVALTCLMSTSAAAAPLNLTLNETPDIVSGFITVEYNAGTDSLTASGLAFELADGATLPNPQIDNGTFNLAANIDETGTFSSGSLDIDGTIPDLGFTSGTLLTGSLTAFGFNPAGGDPLEFLFDVTGGDAFGMFGGIVGVILGDRGFGGRFSSDWSNENPSIMSGEGIADTAPPVPVPAAVWLFGSGIVALFGAARQRKQA